MLRTILLWTTMLFTCPTLVIAQIAEEIVTIPSPSNCDGDDEDLKVETFTVVPSTCGLANGKITLFGSGGIGSYEYLIEYTDPVGITWQTSGEHNNIAPGAYQSWIRNLGETQCFIKGPRIEVVGSVLAVSIQSFGNTRCEGNNGFIELTGTGDSESFEFGLLKKDGESSISWQTGRVFRNLSAGSYRTFIRNATDKSCTKEGPTKTLTNIGLQPKIVIDEVNQTGCGLANGEIELSASGGSASLQFRLNAGPWQTTGTFQNLGQGFYTPEVRNAGTSFTAECLEATTPVEIRGSELISVSVELIENTNCGANNGLIRLTGHGGSGTYEFSIDGLHWQLSGLFLDLGPGNYTPRIRSSTDLSCIKTIDPVTIQSSTAHNVDLKTKSNPTGCGLTNGTLELMTSAPIEDFEFRLNQGSWQQSPVFTNLESGSYIPWIRNSEGDRCQRNGTAIVLASGADIQVTVTKSDLTCFQNNSGSTQLTTTSGTSPFSYDWSGPTTLGNVPGGTNLKAGVYNVTISDANGCHTEKEISITQPAPTSLTFVTQPSTNTTTNDGQIDLKVTGGTAPYVYTWSHGSSQNLLTNIAGDQVYAVTVTDNNQCIRSGTIYLEAVCSEDCESTAVSIIRKRICAGSNYNFYGQILTLSKMYLDPGK